MLNIALGGGRDQYPLEGERRLAWTKHQLYNSYFPREREMP